ncbi:hypothetical protein FB451DRAFT_1344386 [Mycena latifolia]|nr:hypothetical protein FB451DRAFT_1344386 [Mycena latifolia]
MASEGAPIETKEWTLDPETEYRFELDPGTSLAVKLIRGHAEVFGAELAANKPYLFGSECKALFSHAWMHHRDDLPAGPYRPLFFSYLSKTVTGQPSTDIRAGQGWSPLLINTDTSEGGWAAPGALSAAPVHSPLPTCSPASPLGSAATSAPTALSSNALLPPCLLVRPRGIKKKSSLMERIIRNLGENINDKYQVERRAAGLIVDTPSSFAAGPGSSDDRHKLIKACVDAFKINVILVVGHEKLNVEMQRAYGSLLTVVKIPKSGGVIPPPAGISSASLGGETLSDLVLSPSSTMNILSRKRWPPPLPSPSAPARAVSETQAPAAGLLNAVLAVLAPPVNTDESERYDEEILDLPSIRLLSVSTILAPNPGLHWGRTAVVGSFEWQE